LIDFGITAFPPLPDLIKGFRKHLVADSADWVFREIEVQGNPAAPLIVAA
jgi:hypothetical protein